MKYSQDSFEAAGFLHKYHFWFFKLFHYNLRKVRNDTKLL